LLACLLTLSGGSDICRRPETAGAGGKRGFDEAGRSMLAANSFAIRNSQLYTRTWIGAVKANQEDWMLKKVIP
jgi:hypothetical protein